MPTYSIRLINETGARRKYAFFNSPPEVQSSGTDPTVYANAWISTDVASDYTVQTTETFYAWTGTTPSSPSPGVVVQNGANQLTELGHLDAQGTLVHGTTCHMSVINDVPGFGETTMEAPKGAFQIDTDDSFTYKNPYLIGLGKADTTGGVSPVATTMATPSAITSLTPIMKFYVGQFSFQAGEIVDFSTVSAKCGLIDFSSGPGLGKYYAVIKQDEKGVFGDATYHSSATAAEIMQAARDGNLKSYLQQDRLRQLGSLTTTLNQLLQSIGRTEDASVIQKWLGTVTWPQATLISAVTLGAGLILNFLTGRGYGVTISTVRRPDGTWEVNFTLSRNRQGAMLLESDPQSDWNAAVKSIPQTDGHKNAGFRPINSSALAGSPKQNSLKQAHDLLNYEPDNDYGNEYSDNYANGHSNGNGVYKKGHLNGLHSNGYAHAVY